MPRSRPSRTARSRPSACTLPAGEALHLRYALSTATGAPSPTIEQYMLINGDKQLVVSLTNTSEAEASAIAQSIELLY